MKERPILFTGEMVRAILDGRKTQTRRVMKPQLEIKYDTIYCGGTMYCYRYSKYKGIGVTDISDDILLNKCPYGVPGDRLWVRETVDAREPLAKYVADGEELEHGHRLLPCKIIPSIHMPRRASRIDLEVTDVRVQRVQEISDEDARAEGWPIDCELFPTVNSKDKSIAWFSGLWNKINAPRGFGWENDPWVWAITFRRIK